MANSAFSQSSEAEQQHMPPESARWPLWPWFLIMAALAVVLVVWAWIPQVTERPDELLDGERHAAVGTKVTRFQLEPLTGEGSPVTEADLAAAATLVNFWGPWCGACVIEFPHLVELEQHFRSNPGFQFFSVSTNQSSNELEGLAESTTQFLKHFKAEFPTYYDPKKETTIALVEAAKLEAFGYPTTVLLGSGGVIRGVWSGYHAGDEIKIREAIEKALRENGDLP
jgi:thiol-disulfide isomerase/thioredoxin